MHVADDTFVSLADLLRPPLEERAPIAAPVPARDEPPAVNEDLRAYADVARDVRVFRAQLADAFDAALDTLLRECTYAVLGRELQLADCDIAAIVARIVAGHPAAQPIRVRVAPGDLARCVAGATLPPCIGDALLAPGDAIVELAGGTVDARLGIRLAALFENAS